MASQQKAQTTEVMVVNDAPGEECRIAVLEDCHLEELYSERTSTATNVGNIYKGRVTNVERAIQAAFIDYGEGANGFLHISDLHPRYFPGAERTERVGKKIPRRERPPIQDALKRGDEVLVQVLKEGIGTKGPTLTSYLSVPGRHIVMMPDMDRVGVSRKVEDEEKRREMRRILDSLDLPDGFGFILRTAGFDRTKTDLKRDVAYLTRLWKVMDKRIKSVAAPCELYTESDLLIRTVRDVLRPSISAVIVDSQSAHERVSSFLRVIAPRSAPRVVRYRRKTPIFHAFDIERQIELIHSREVPLSSGGRLVIEQTEALVAIDVNSGKSRGASDSETNAYQTNCEAVDEICRQLRLRDLGGLVINDLIDMRMHRHRRQIEERFRANLKRDRARTTILRISDFGLLEMTRQRMRPSLRKSHFMACPHCEGHGEIKAPDSVAADVTRQVSFLLDHERVKRVEIVCSPRVASVLLSRKRRELVHLEDGTGKMVDVRVSDDIAQDRVDYYAYDDRNADINVEHLPAIKTPSLTALEEEDALAAQAGLEEAPAAGKAKTARKRSRRRKKSGPADATAIALAGGFDEDLSDEESKEPQGAAKKRSRRRRRRRKADTAESEAPAGEAPPETADEQTAEAPARRKRSRRRKKPEAEDTAKAAQAVEAEVKAAAHKPMRVHELARELNVASRDVLDRVRDADTIEVRNHMSSVTPEAADMIRALFGHEAGAAADEGEVSADKPERPAARRRRRRGGRKHRPRAGAEPAISGDTAGEGKPAEPEAVAKDEPAGVGKKKKTRRSRRRKRAQPAEAADTSAGSKAESDSPPGEEKAGDPSPTRSRKKKRKKTTAPRSEKKSPSVAADDGSPKVAATARKKRKKRKKKTEPKPPPEETAVAVLAGSTDSKRPKRRTLYRSRKKLSAASAARESQAENDTE